MANDMMRRLHAMYDSGLIAGEKLSKQFMLDTMRIAAHQHLCLGPKRLKAFIQAWAELYTRFYPVFRVKNSDECDFLRGKLDELVAETLLEGEERTTFEQRYPEIKSTVSKDRR